MFKRAVFFVIFSLVLFPTLLFARVGVDIDFGLGVTISNDDLFLRINAHYFDREPDLVRGIVPRLPVPDIDLPIILFLAHNSGRDADVIIGMHKKGLSWWDISLKFGIPVSVYFLDLGYDPGPPYGRAYGYWKKHRANPKYRVVLSDRQMCDLISLQVTSKYYGLPPRDVIKLRSEGEDFKVIFANEYKHRHVPPGHAREKEKEKGKEKEKEKHEHEHGKKK